MAKKKKKEEEEEDDDDDEMKKQKQNKHPKIAFHKILINHSERPLAPSKFPR